MSNHQLQDTFVIDGVRKTSDGYVTAFVRAGRTGVQMYRGSELGRPDLDVVRVYRPPEEVFSSDAMRSFAHRPVTLRHPPKPVNANNWKQYAGGQTGDDVVRDGEYVRVPMVMMDEALIDAYEKKGIDQLSWGYSCDIQWRQGIVDEGSDVGQHYDAVQTAIRANHLAVVPLARGGDKLRIGDTATCPECGAKMHSGKCQECGYTTDGEREMKVTVIDGFNVNFGDEQSSSIVTRVLDGFTKKLADAEADLENFKKKKKEDDEVKDAALKQVETKDGEIAVLKKQLADAEVTPAKLDALVKDRLAVIDGASKVLPKDFAFDGKSILEIRKAAVEAKLGDAAKNMSDGAIEGAFAALTIGAKDDAGSRPIADALRARPGNFLGDSSAPQKVRDEAADKYADDLSNAWKTPAAS